MTNAVRDSPVLGYKPDPFSQRYLPRVFNPWERYWKGERIETHSWNVMADDETGIRLFSSTEKDNTSSIPRIKMQFLIFYSKEKIDSANGLGFTYLYLCRKSAHWHSSIFKIGTVGKPAILEKWKICKLWRALGAHLVTRPGRTATLQKRDSTPPRCSTNPWKRRKRLLECATTC